MPYAKESLGKHLKNRQIQNQSARGPFICLYAGLNCLLLLSSAD